jgi:hypothetical protein
MRWTLLATAVAAAAVAAPAGAQQVGADRHFTHIVTDTNRSDRIIYAPIGMAFSGPRPGSQPYDVSAATWYRQPLGSQNVKPDKNLEKAQYTLESFDAVKDQGLNQIRVVITRRPAPPEGTEAPRIAVVHPDSAISSTAFPKTEMLADGVRYTYMVMPPNLGFASRRDQITSDRYEIRFQPARDVHIPRYITKAPTFGGEDHEARDMAAPPPSLPRTERVAGKRLEYRRGRVVGD